MTDTGSDTWNIAYSFDTATPTPTLATESIPGGVTHDRFYRAGQWAAILLNGATLTGIGVDALGDVIPTTPTVGLYIAGDSATVFWSPNYRVYGIQFGISVGAGVQGAAGFNDTYVHKFGGLEAYLAKAVWDGEASGIAVQERLNDTWSYSQRRIL